MALIVETGAIVAGAESYISVAAADLYHANRGNTDWAALSTTQKEQALRKATDYLVAVYRGSWRGYRTNAATQVLDWPRMSILLADAALNQFVDMHSMPVEVLNATAELALRASIADLIPDLERGVKQETIGPITTVYDDYSPQSKRYRFIEAMLAPYLRSGGVAVGLVRT